MSRETSHANYFTLVIVRIFFFYTKTDSNLKMERKNISNIKTNIHIKWPTAKILKTYKRLTTTYKLIKNNQQLTNI